MNEHNLNYYARNSPKIRKPPLKQPQSLLTYQPIKRFPYRQFSLHNSVNISQNHTIIQSCQSDNNQYIRIEDSSEEQNWNKQKNMILILDSGQDDNEFDENEKISLKVRQAHLSKDKKIQNNPRTQYFSNNEFHIIIQKSNETEQVLRRPQKQKNQNNVQCQKKNLLQQQKTQQTLKRKEAIRHFSFGEKNQDIMKDIDLINNFAQHQLQGNEKQQLEDSCLEEQKKYKKDVESDSQTERQFRKSKNGPIIAMFTAQQKQKLKNYYGKSNLLRKSCLERSSKSKKVKNIEDMSISAKQKKQIQWIQFLRALQKNQFMKIRQSSEEDQSSVKLNEAISIIASQNTNLSLQKQVQSFSNNQQQSQPIRNTEESIEGLSKIHNLTNHESELLQNQYNFFADNFQEQHAHSRRQSTSKPILELIHFQYEASSYQSNNQKIIQVPTQNKQKIQHENSQVNYEKVWKNQDIANLTTSRGKQKRQISMRFSIADNIKQDEPRKQSELLDKLLELIKQLPQELRVQYLQIYDHYFLEKQRAKIKMKQQETILTIMHCLVSLAKNHIHGEQYAISDIKQKGEAQIKMNQLIIQGLIKKLAYL